MNKLTILTFLGVMAVAVSCKKTVVENPDRTITSASENDNSAAVQASPNEKYGGLDLNKIQISTADLGIFPYLKLPAGYVFTDPDHVQNGNGKGITTDLDKEYFLNDGVYFPVEGKTFKGHINLDRDAKDKNFSPLEIEKNFDELISKMGGVQINKGKGYRDGEKDRINTADAQAESTGYLNSSQYYDNIHTYIIRKSDYNVWIQYNLGGETGYISVLQSQNEK